MTEEMIHPFGKKGLILASASPRRRELLEQIGIPFEVFVSEADESVEEGLKPWEMVELLSERKGMAVFENLKEKKTVIGADTVVAIGEEDSDSTILGKPATRENAVAMLKLLRNRGHKVYTGVTILLPDGRKKTFYEKTDVFVSAMSDREIEEYVETGDPMDKAGAYGIQGFFARYIAGIRGDYNNVVGLPVGRLYRELDRLERKNAPKKAVIFDLDGTLSDSIASMKYCGNACLKELGLRGFEEEDYKYFVGDGAANLVRRILAAAGDGELTHFEEAYRRYKEIFAENCMRKVKPYEGITALLDSLKKKGIYLAVLSNKPHAQSIEVVETLFGKGVFDIICGQEEGRPIKPDPAGVFQILQRFREEMGVELRPENLIYLGDTGTDMKTGRSAGAFTVGALWGFRKKEELLENGADELIAAPLQLTEYVRPQWRT